MWYLMEHVQRSYTLSERLLRAIGVGGTRQEDIEQLIRQGANVNQAHGTFLPLHCACMMGDASSVAVLLKWGADVNRFDGYHRTALHHAAEHSASCTALLLAAGAETENVDTNGNTALHWAAFRNRADCCRLLLEHGADADCTDFNHDTPLSWAAMKVGPLWALSLEEPWHPGDFRLIDPLEGTPLGIHQPVRLGHGAHFLSRRHIPPSAWGKVLSLCIRVHPWGRAVDSMGGASPVPPSQAGGCHKEPLPWFHAVMKALLNHCGCCTACNYGQSIMASLAKEELL